MLADPSAPDYQQMAEWTASRLGRPVGEQINVHAFDLEAANDAVRRLPAGAGHGGPPTA